MSPTLTLEAATQSVHIKLDGSGEGDGTPLVPQAATSTPAAREGIDTKAATHTAANLLSPRNTGALHAWTVGQSPRARMEADMVVAQLLSMGDSPRCSPSSVHVSLNSALPRHSEYATVPAEAAAADVNTCMPQLVLR